MAELVASSALPIRSGEPTQSHRYGRASRRRSPGRSRPAKRRRAKKRTAAARVVEGQPLYQTVKMRSWRQRFGRKSAKGAPGVPDALLTVQALRASDDREGGDGLENVASVESAAAAGEQKDGQSEARQEEGGVEIAVKRENQCGYETEPAENAGGCGAPAR